MRGSQRSRPGSLTHHGKRSHCLPPVHLEGRDGKKEFLPTSPSQGPLSGPRKHGREGSDKRQEFGFNFSRKLFLERQQRILVRSINPGMRLVLHSCGPFGKGRLQTRGDHRTHSRVLLSGFK